MSVNLGIGGGFNTLFCSLIHCLLVVFNSYRFIIGEKPREKQQLKRRYIPILSMHIHLRLFFLLFLCTPTFAVQCSAGKYRSKNTCLLCPRGEYSANPGQPHCIPCPPATYQDNTGASSCVQCRTDSFNSQTGATSAADCTSCGEAKRWSITHNRVQGTDNVNNCICPMKRVDYGEFAPSTVERCQECTLGSDCTADGTTLPTLNTTRGFWRQDSISGVFYKCLSKYEDCLGGGTSIKGSVASNSNMTWSVNNQCRYGNTGVLCATCLKGWVRDSGGLCVNCFGSKEGVGPTFALLSGVFFLVFFCASLAMTCPPGNHGKLKAMRRSKKVQNQMKILLGFMVRSFLQFVAVHVVVERS